MNLIAREHIDFKPVSQKGFVTGTPTVQGAEDVIRRGNKFKIDNKVKWKCNCGSTEREVCCKAYRCVNCFSFAGNVIKNKENNSDRQDVALDIDGPFGGNYPSHPADMYS